MGDDDFAEAAAVGVVVEGGGGLVEGEDPVDDGVQAGCGDRLVHFREEGAVAQGNRAQGDGGREEEAGVDRVGAAQ